MDQNKKKFEDLYEEYKRLKIATHLEAQIGRRSQLYKIHYINPDDLMRRKDLAKELVKNYKEYFEGKPAEWFDLKLDVR
jgi:hypothetical protein